MVRLAPGAESSRPPLERVRHVADVVGRAGAVRIHPGRVDLAGRPGQLFSPDELQFLETVARHICMAVDRAQASRSEARRNAEARALVSLARAIGGIRSGRPVA